MEQKEKIAEFLRNLRNSTLPEREQVLLFSQDDDKNGAGDSRENDKCINRAFTCGGSDTYNKECTNYDYYCVSSSNGKCVSESSPNFDIASCGGAGGD